MLRDRNSSDVALCFLPQWSPFQPPLSLPSLAAWIRREGYDCDVYDANIAFYEFLLSDTAAKILLDEVSAGNLRDTLTQAAAAGVSCWRDFRHDVQALIDWGRCPDEVFRANRSLVVRDTYRAANSLDTYLKFVSALSPDFSVSPYDFYLKNRMMNRDDVEQFVEAPPTLLSTFSAMVAQRLLEVHPRLIGLSCIGQEQFVFALLVGKELKRLSNTPVLVGGTVYSRIVERGSFPANWFDRYLDVIVRNEGEKPLEAILRLPNIDKSQLQCVPGIVYKDNDCVRQTKVCDPLVPIELPVPDFDGMPLRNYISARITLPILSSRGCYWGHCEFCHHGMVYGEKYANYKSPDVIGALTELRTKYKVNYFAFNDEAIPPKTFRQLGQTLADSDDGMYFTGLMKFEKYFTADDFDNAFKAGFRSLYIGLESASERVLRLMRKNTEKAVMERNLRDGTNAGIWMHCFLFFGFPGEQPEDALETVDFILQHADIIGSFGAGTFSLEHNAPAAKQMEKHGLRVVGGEMGDLDVYYKYVVEVGIDQEQAVQFMNDLNATAYKEERYSATNWIPREHLLILLSNFSQEELVQECAKLLRSRNVGIFDQAREEISLVPSRSDIDQMIVINRLNRAVVKIRGASLKVVQYGCEDGIPLNVICGKLPWLGAELASTSNARLAMHESTKVI